MVWISSRSPRVLLGALIVAASGCMLAPGLTASASAACPASIPTLAPPGKAPQRFTMMLRINKLDNVATFASADPATGGLRDRIRPQDIFVVNTRFEGGDPELASQILSELRARFPCNRLVALNGLGADPSTNGYRYALTDRPELFAALLDWEQSDWKHARETAPGTPKWALNFKRALGRISKYTARLASALAQSLPPRGRRAGLIPTYYERWDYGRIAKSLDRRNDAVRAGRNGLQVVQAQASCDRDALIPYGELATRIFRQYAPPPRIVTRKRKDGKKIKTKVKVKPLASLANLGLEVSFSDTPDPNAELTIGRVAPGAAAKCTRTALKRGGGAFLYWATPDSMRALLDTKRICVLRPPAGGQEAC